MINIVLSNGSLIDGNGNIPLNNYSIVISNDKIINIGPTKDIYIPIDSNIYNMEGKSFLPGFINAHVHNAFNEINLTDWAYDGVTTVRDLSLLSDDVNPFEYKSKTSRNYKYSRIVTIGYLLATTSGYVFDFMKPPFIVITDVKEAVEKTQWLIDQGADIIKMILESNSFFGEEVPVLSKEIVDAVVKTANNNGTIACAHVTCVKDLEKAIHGNVNDIVHMPGDLIPMHLIEKMVENNIYLEPTFELWENAEEVLNIKTSVNENLVNFISSGGNISLGSDFDGWPEMTSERGMPLKEINFMLEAGMSPMQIITACTKNAAFVCNLGGQIGTIEVGKQADIIVVDGNPLDDLKVLKGNKMVIHNGEMIRELV